MFTVCSSQTRRKGLSKEDSPDEVLAMTAKRRLLEEAWNEAMVFNVVNVLLLQSSLSSPVPESQLVVGVVLGMHVFFSHLSLLSCFVCCYQFILKRFTFFSPNDFSLVLLEKLFFSSDIFLSEILLIYVHTTV